MAKTLTLGETAAVEGISGLPIDALNDPTAPKSKLIAALVMVLKKRSDPDFTLDDAWAMDTQDAAALIQDFFGDEEDPKDKN
jgi:hypothetical protein